MSYAFEGKKQEGIDAVCEAGQILMNVLNAFPPMREMSIAKTKLEEMVMWAVKGITAVTPPTEKENDDKINE